MIELEIYATQRMIKKMLISKPKHTIGVYQWQVLKGLQVKVNLNLMDGEKYLSAQVQNILFNVEMEILMELITHYEQLSIKLWDKSCKNLNNIKACTENQWHSKGHIRRF